jgi:hypothetical protein
VSAIEEVHGSRRKDQERFKVDKEREEQGCTEEKDCGEESKES